ncbi:PAP2-domain-containing protein [Atractiella rhizophila]|nr:PAP2-domain-containing protein [Atractiella rhizophila]
MSRFSRKNPQDAGFQQENSPTREGAYGTRYTFREWAGDHWLDIITLALLGAVGLGVYFADPAPSRSFAIEFRDGEIVDPEFAFPLRHEIVPIWLAALLAFIIPFLFFVIAQIRVRSFEDLNTATFGLLYSLVTAAVFQVFLKWLIGGLRPHFLAVCQPDMNRIIDQAGDLLGNGYARLYFQRDICTGDQNQINDSLESFPSGHSTAAWAGFVFLSLYFNGKLKTFADYRPHYWKMVFFFAPLLGACLISGALTIDKYHHAHDVIAGAFIGTATAFASYRMSYASVWDFRFNHLPLSRRVRYPYELQSWQRIGPFTRSAGWNLAGGSGIAGAPFDTIKMGGGTTVGSGAHGPRANPV